MSCWREKFNEVGTKFGLLGIVPWCAMAACNVVWEVMAMVVT
jgi:hypothetical protein